MRLHEREHLMVQLASIHRQARRGQGRLVLVTGEAGIGKTSLMRAFCDEHARGARVWWGTGDAIVPPRPLAPIAEIAELAGGPLRSAMDAGEPKGVLEAFVELVAHGSGARIVVLDDLQWADDATLEVLGAVTRRVRHLPVLVIGAYRDDEVGEDHPLRRALDAVAPGAVETLPVPPLSDAAIRLMARGTGIDPDGLSRTAAGNPFFVTEVIAGGGAAVPTSIRDAVLARSARLSAPAQRALRAASVLGPRWERGLLQEVAGCGERAVRECESGGMLVADAATGFMGFRHDLAQAATLSALHDTERRRLHARALAILGAQTDGVEADPARLAWHAVGARDADAVAQLAPVAGDRASALGSHREAAQHYRAALEMGTAPEPRRRAELLEAHARESRIADRLQEAIDSQAAAIAAWRALGDGRREGDATHVLAQLHWFAGDVGRARAAAEDAVALLEPIRPHGAELARAYAAVAQRAATIGTDDERGLRYARRAVRLAERVGAERVAIDALISRGVIEVYRRPKVGFAVLGRAARRAARAGLHEEEARALINIVEAGRDLREYEIAGRYRLPAMACVDEHHLDMLRRRLMAGLAELDLERGRWADAEELAEAVLGEVATAPLIRAKALLVAGLLGARRGDADPWPALDEALELVGPAGEGQDLSPIRAARAEAAWLDGDVGRATEEARHGMALAPAFDSGWWLGEIAHWMQRLVPDSVPPEQLAEPYALQLAGRSAEAARRWEAIGAPYRQAMALVDSSVEADLRRALALLHRLGARRVANVVRRRLRVLGATGVPRGPRHSTRRNPAQLTDRQLDVLALLGEGLTNAEIARRLVVSVKTVDHHVSAVLRKLEVRRRAVAGRRAAVLLADIASSGAKT